MREKQLSAQAQRETSQARSRHWATPVATPEHRRYFKNGDMLGRNLWSHVLICTIYVSWVINISTYGI